MCNKIIYVLLNAERMNYMKVRKARIANVYTVLNLVDRKLELGFVIQFYDNDNNLGISFKEEHEGDLDTFYSLMELYHRDKLCFLEELLNKDIWVLQGNPHGIAFAKPYTDRWVVVNAEDRFYNEDEVREILISKNQGE